MVTAELECIEEFVEIPVATDDFGGGGDDARAFLPMRSGMSKAYYDGYAFACAVDGLS